jgi:hypothetical protein
MQPANIELGDPLSTALREGVDALALTVVQELARRGYPAEGFVTEPVDA